MRSLKLNDDEYLIPGEWNELTKYQLIYLVALVNKNITSEEIKLKLLLYCMEATVYSYDKRKTGYDYLIKSGKKKYTLSAEEVTVICQMFDYLFTEYNGQIVLYPTLTKNPFPETKCGCRSVYGPADGLTNINYQQFVDLQIWQSQLDKNKSAVNEFISVIYLRSEYNSEQNFKYTSPHLIATMSPTVKTIILWFYLGCLAFIEKKFPLPFSGSGGKGNVVDGQMRIIDALAENKVINKDLVRKSLLYDALYTMQLAAEQSAKMQTKT